jgi:hypothetical protein
MGAGSGAAGATGGMGAGTSTAGGVGASGMGGASGTGGTPAGMGASGGGGAGTSGSGPTLDLPAGIAPGTRVADLTEADALALCDTLNMQLDAIVSSEDVEQVGCTLWALLFSVNPATGAVDPSACASTRDACIADPSGGSVMTTSECNTEATMTLPDDCNVTIGEYADCLAASIALIDGFLDAFSCETLADPTVAATAFAMPDPSEIPACAPIQQSCPSLLDLSASGPPAADGCDDTCSDAMDFFCDDGGPGSLTNICALGTDCTDCGPR